MNHFTEKPVKSGFIMMAIPIILSLFTQQLHLLVSTIIVGRYLGVDELAAVGNATSLIAVFLIISGGLEMGCEVILGKYMGKKQYDKIISYIYGILIFSIIIAVVLTALAILSRYQLFEWMNIDPALWSLTSDYMMIYCLSFIFIFIFDISRAFLISMGDAKTAFIIILFSSFFNIGLSLLFINVFHWGISGAALATLFTQMVGMAITLVMVQKRLKKLSVQKESVQFKSFNVHELISVSCPLMVQQGVATVSALLLQVFINPYGSEVISGYIAVTKVITLIIIVFIGFGQTLSVFTATNAGAGNIERVREGYRFCLQAVLTYSIFIITINYFFADQIMALFIDIELYPAAAAFGETYIKCSFFMLLLYGLKSTNESLLRGYAKMKSFLFSNLSDLFIRVAMTALLIPIFDLNSFWIAYTLGIIISLTISSILLRRTQMSTSMYRGA
ncbi:MAG: MATE family efflux transporter [Bacillus sp. (in: firmicutes)]